MPSLQAPHATQVAWLKLHEFHNWSLERVAQTWHVPVNEVAEALHTLSLEPLAEVRTVPRLPSTPAEAQQRRAQLQQLYRQGWSIERLAETFLYYSKDFITHLVGPRKPQRQTPGSARACACGCGFPVLGRGQYATDACRSKDKRAMQGLKPTQTRQSRKRSRTFKK
jgi:hypothetical protein